MLACALCRVVVRGCGRSPTGINSTFQLIGQFLLMREPGMNTREHCDAFAAWLKTKGISSHRNQIIRVIAEKVNTMLPGLYNEEELE